MNIPAKLQLLTAKCSVGLLPVSPSEHYFRNLGTFMGIFWYAKTKYIYRGYLLFFLGEYQIYFIECVENISNFTST